MRRPIFAEADRVVRKDVDRPEVRERGQTNRGPHVVGEDQEGAAERDEAAMQRDPVQRGSHRMLANSIVKVSARPPPLYFGVVRARPIGGSAPQLPKLPPDPLQYFAVRGTQRL